MNISIRNNALKSLCALLIATLFCIPAFSGCTVDNTQDFGNQSSKAEQTNSVDSKTSSNNVSSYSSTLDLPEFDGEPFVYLNNNQPRFSSEEINRGAFEQYAPLDDLGRCGTACVLVTPDTMPDTPRESIGDVKPTGWQIAKYDFVDGKYLYNRCHLIGHQLTGKNAFEPNLITGTRALNIFGMLPFENAIADYVHNTQGSVLYRVTPCFVDDELLARGVQMEAYSIEDNGATICFNVYCFNAQPNVYIDYATGNNCLKKDCGSLMCEQEDSQQHEYVLNTNSKRYHNPECGSVSEMKRKNQQSYTGTQRDLSNKGYSPCGRCNP